jgi:hypothetical protein
VLPDPEFWVLDAAPVPRSATPTLGFELRVRDLSEREVYAVALTVQLQIEAAQRPHDDATRERLLDLFGEPERWGDTARGLLWARRDVLVGGFTGSTRFELQLPLSLDLELASVKYFTAVPDGEVPIAFHFNGTVHYRGAEDRLQITQVPWSAEAQYQLPIETWRRTIREHYPPGAFLRLGEDTMDGLRRYKSARGLPSFDACLAELLEGARLEA